MRFKLAGTWGGVKGEDLSRYFGYFCFDFAVAKMSSLAFST